MKIQDIHKLLAAGWWKGYRTLVSIITTTVIAAFFHPALLGLLLGMWLGWSLWDLLHVLLGPKQTP